MDALARVHNKQLLGVRDSVPQGAQALRSAGGRVAVRVTGREVGERTGQCLCPQDLSGAEVGAPPVRGRQKFNEHPEGELGNQVVVGDGGVLFADDQLADQLGP